MAIVPGRVEPSRREEYQDIAEGIANLVTVG